MRKLVELSLLAAAAAWVFATPASAASLEFVDGDTTWTLTVEEGCDTDCSVTVNADIGDSDDGTYLDSVQWQVDGQTIVDADLTSDPGGDWTTTINDSISNDPGSPQNTGDNNCDDGPGGNAGSACSEWVESVATGLLVNSGDSLTWVYSVDWSESFTLTDEDEGNIRALFQDESGQLVNLFSPGGTTFTTTTTDIPTTTTTDIPTTTENIPEPTLLTLLGAGLVMAGRRLRRRTK